MQSFELEEMALFLIRDADEAEMWIDRWAVSYPIVQTAEADSRQTISEWQHAIQTAFDHIVSKNIAVVAHGAGVSAFLAWLYQADIMTQKRLTNIILVSPRPEAFP
ncbi:alpha/beta hydrolase, partial [Neisseria sp. P0015.S010]